MKTEKFEIYKKQILSIIHATLPKCKVYLFGSRARDEHDAGADIDIALDAGFTISAETLAFVDEKIKETTIPLTVDIVDLQTAPEKLKAEIENEGILWES